jgi:hypothetical protein
MGRPQRRQGRRRDAHDLFRRERHGRGQGSVFRPLLPHQHRRHGPSAAESSNVDNAYPLQGKVQLVVGELDQNMDPASTFQVVNQLIKHNKDFELLVIPGAGHGNGGAYGEHKRFDFFTRHLLGQTSPEWKMLEELLKKGTSPATSLQ